MTKIYKAFLTSVPIIDLEETSTLMPGANMFLQRISDGKSFKINTEAFYQILNNFAKPLKLSDSTPTVNGWYKPATSGTYGNAGDLVAEDGYDTLFYKDGTNWTRTRTKMPIEGKKNIFTFSDFQNALHVPGNTSSITVSIGDTIVLGWIGSTPDIATIKIPIKNGDKAFVFTKQGAFSPCFITNYSNVVTQVFGTTPGNYLTTPLDITSTTDGYLYINAHEFVTAERDLIRVYTGDAYSLEKISRNNNTETYTTVKKTVKKNGTIGVDCDYTDIRDALSAITDNSAKKRYILYVMDGNYDYSNDGQDVGIRLKNYVTLRGQSYNTRIIKRDSVFSWAKATVDKESGDVDYLAIEGFFTIISNNCKCPLHIDSNKVKYGLFQNINLINEQPLGTGDNPVDGEANCFALGWNGSDHIVLKNIKANGKLWGHNSTDTQSKGIFEIINCICPRIQIGDLTSQGSDDIIVKGCNVDEFQLLWFSEFTSSQPARSSFNFTFEGNDIKNAVIKDHAGTHDALEEFYKGKFPFAIAGIHKEFYGTGITKGSDVSKVNNSTVKTWQSGETVFGKALENTDANGRLLIQYK